MRKTKPLFALGAGLAGVSLASLGGGVTASQSPYGEALENFMGASPAFACNNMTCDYLPPPYGYFVCSSAVNVNCNLGAGGQNCDSYIC